MLNYSTSEFTVKKEFYSFGQSTKRLFPVKLSSVILYIVIWERVLEGHSYPSYPQCETRRAIPCSASLSYTLSAFPYPITLSYSQVILRAVLA